MTIKNESFLAIEKSMATKIGGAVRSELGKQSLEIARDAKAGRYADAHSKVDKLNIDEKILKKEKYIKLMAVQAALFGARDFSKANNTKVFKDEIPDIVIQGVNSTIAMLCSSTVYSVKKSLHKLLEAQEEELKSEVYKVQKAGFIKEFVTFVKKTGDSSVQVASSLHTSRFASWGFLTEATLLEETSFKVSEVLDVKICPVCRSMDGKVFEVSTSLSKLERVLSVDDPAGLKSIAPWPRQDKASLEKFRAMSDQELVDAGWETPPYHPMCRGILRKTSQTAFITVTPPVNTDDFLRQLLDAPEEVLVLDVIDNVVVDSPYLPDVKEAALKLVDATDISANSRGSFLSKNDFILQMFDVDTKTMENKLAKIIDDSDVYMAMNSTTLRNQILKGDKKFKNSLETKKGTFTIVAEDRVPKERDVFGITSEVDDYDAFPKYGFLSDKNGMNNKSIVDFGYGDTFIKFKKDNIKNRTTVTLGDSYNNNHDIVDGKRTAIAPSVKLSDPNTDLLLGISHRLQPDKSVVDKLKAAKTIDDLAEYTEYPEAQIYGELVAEDIAEVSTGSIKQAKMIRAALKKAGLEDVEVVPAKHDLRMEFASSYDNANNRLRASLSLEDLDRLGDSFISRMDYLGSAVGMYDGGRYSGFLGELGDMVKEWSGTKGAAIPVSEKRKFQELLTVELAKKEAGSAPKVWWEDYRANLSGWTEDVYNQDLLKG